MIRRLPEPVRRVVAEAVEAATWIKVRRALAALASCPVEQQGPEVTVHILSSFNLEPILPALELGLRCIPSRAGVTFAPLDTIEQELLDPHAAAYTKKTLATIILWRAEELMPDLFFPMSGGGPNASSERAAQIVDRIKNVTQAFLENGTGLLFIATLPFPTAAGVVLDSQLANGMAATISEVNAAIYRLAAANSRLRVLDVNRWAAGQSLASYDMQMDFLARQPFSTRGGVSFGFFLAGNLRPLLVPRRKVVAVDLDNTLWGGIVGEDGVSQLKLGRDFPGSVFLRIQKELLELKRQGVLLVMASKNTEQEARQAFADLPDMALRWEDFVCRQVNFDAKYLNLRQAAKELGLGLDSFALLDDSDYEREQMRQFNPEVEIINDGGDALQILNGLLRTDVFDTHHLSEEDRMRHQDYELRAARSIQPQGNIEDFLRSLELRAKVEAVGNGNMERVVQMLGKTNQFNVTTRRHSRDEVARMVTTPGAICLTLRLTDKFGDQGIVGVLLALPGPAEAEARVDSFLVSCRALGRGVEEVLWSELLTRAKNTGVKNLEAEYIPTAKNPVVAKLYDRFGMERVEETETRTRYRLQHVKPIVAPAWVAVERTGI